MHHDGPGHGAVVDPLAAGDDRAVAGHALGMEDQAAVRGGGVPGLRIGLGGLRLLGARGGLRGEPRQGGGGQQGGGDQGGLVHLWGLQNLKLSRPYGALGPFDQPTTSKPGFGRMKTQVTGPSRRVTCPFPWLSSM